MLNSPGAILKQARKKKKYHIDKICKSTKIKREFIEALENDEPSAFPAELYYKNFLKSYALYLNLNPNELVKMYEQSKIEQQKCLFKQNDKKVENKFVCFCKNNKKLLIYVGFCVVIIFLIIMVYLVNRKIEKHKIQEQNVTSNNIAISSLTEDIPNPIGQAKQAKKVQQEEVTEQPEQNKQILYIEAIENTWIKVVADNKEVFEGTVTKYLECKAKDEFIVKIGNVDTVEVYFNDKAIDIATVGSVSKNNVGTLILSRNNNEQ